MNKNMEKTGTYTIDYEVPTANGYKVIHRYETENRDEFEKTCQTIERLKWQGYKIILVNRF